MKIIAVVVTYNRLALLKECIAALFSQLRVPDEIIVINNSSTDGTGEWLQTKNVTVVTQPNLGGSWGFYTGVKTAYQNGADWVWIMDDDTIAEKDCLQKLTDAVNITNQNNIKTGFLASKVLFTDGNLHMMNKQVICKEQKHSVLNTKNIYEIEFSSFVSLMVNREAIKELGLPMKEFYIWGDDVEYTKRIITNGYAGLLVNDSVAIHKTPTNYKSDIYADVPGNLWKYKYGIRNELYLRKKYKSKSSYYRNLMKSILRDAVKLFLKRKDNKWAFVKTYVKSSLSAVTFNPQPEKVD